MRKLSDQTVDELNASLKTTRAIQVTSGTIFSVIILAWIVLGYWKTNTPVFVSTVTLAIGLMAATSVTPRRLKAELLERARRES